MKLNNVKALRLPIPKKNFFSVLYMSIWLFVLDNLYLYHMDPFRRDLRRQIAYNRLLLYLKK